MCIRKEDGHRRNTLWSLLLIWQDWQFVKVLLFWTVWFYVVETGHAGPTKRWLLMQDGHCYRIPASWKRQPDILQDTEKSNWQTANTGGQFKVSCFVKESGHTLWPTGWRWNITEELWVTDQVVSCLCHF